MKPTLEELYARCNEVGECREWTGSYAHKAPPRCPQVYVHGSDGKGGMRSVRRLVVEIARGAEIRSGYHPMPSVCLNQRCVCDAHIKLVTNRDVLALSGALASPTRRARIALSMRARPGAKLTDAKVAEILASDLSNTALAAIHGVSHSMISAVRLRKTWRPVLAGASVFALGAGR